MIGIDIKTQVIKLKGFDDVELRAGFDEYMYDCMSEDTWNGKEEDAQRVLRLVANKLWLPYLTGRRRVEAAYEYVLERSNEL